MSVELDDLEMALEFASSSNGFDGVAYLDKELGKTLLDYDGTEDVIPEDITTNPKYIEIPSKHDLELGKPVALRFALEEYPDEYETVAGYFRSRGAYSKYKAFLERKHALEKWYAFEQAAIKKALLEWCTENDICL